MTISRPGSTKLHKVHYPSSPPGWPGKLLCTVLQWPVPASPAAAASPPLSVPFLDVTRLQLGPARYQLLAVKAFCKLLCCLTKLSFCAFMNRHRTAPPPLWPNHEIQLKWGCGSCRVMLWCLFHPWSPVAVQAGRRECDHSRCSPTNTVTHTKNSAQSRSPRAAGAGRVPSPL